MNSKRLLGIMIVLSTLAVALPVSGLAADDAKDLSVYFRPAVRFGTDDRVLFIMDFLMPVYRGDKDIVFINTKFTPDTDEAWETNAGLGYRRMLSDRLILGGNLFYDHHKTAFGSHFNQIGLGLEAMAELNGLGLATRLNYYQPLNKAKLGEDFGYVFYGNGIYTAGVEEPMTGFDYEAGLRIPGISEYVETWAYAGGYHFFGSHVPDVNGFSARIEATPTDFVRLGFEYRNDNINHDEYYGEVALEIPFSITNLVAGKNAFEGLGDVFTGSRSLKERMTEPVHRDVDIVVGKDYLSGPEAASGEGDLAAGVIFVSDAGTDSGTGTFENPYNTLAKAEADGRLGSSIYTIHVMRGNGTGLIGNDFDTHSTGITIWGAGAANLKYPYVDNLVPGWPLVTSTLAMDAQNMTVMGLYFNTSSDAAIRIDSNAAGAGLTIADNRIYSTGPYGIRTNFTTADLGTPASPAVISGNTISLVRASGHAFAICFEITSSHDIYTSILDNVLDRVSSEDSLVSGMHLIGRDIAGLISGNTINNLVATTSGNVWAQGIHIETWNTFTASITDNTMSNITASGGTAFVQGIHIRLNGSDSGTLGGTIEGNTIHTSTGNGTAYGISLGADNDSAVTTSVVGNTLEVTSPYAYGLRVDSIGTIGAVSTPLIFTGNTGTINGSTRAYMAYLNTYNAADCNVSIGTDTSGLGMGDNSFTSVTGHWNGNYLTTGGPIWAAGGGSFIHQ